MINNSPPDGSACTPTPPARRDGTFYANKSSCLKTFAFLIGPFTGKICFWVVICQNGVQRCPTLPGAQPGEGSWSCGCAATLAQENKLDTCQGKAEGKGSPCGFFPPCVLSFLWVHILLSLLHAALPSGTPSSLHVCVPGQAPVRCADCDDPIVG